MRKERGFTLLEVLLATLIISVGVIALVWAFSSGLSATADIENVDLALNIAQANMEMLKNKTFAQIDTDAEISSLVSNLGFSNFTVTGDVTTEVLDQRIQVDVTVTWNVKGGSTSTTSITLTTLVTKPVSY
jgi:prepilin-type N-terminal cleavage/methylation domain-containing protein